MAQVEVKYDLGDGEQLSTGAVPLEMTYTAAGHGYVNAEVARHIDEVQIYELNANLQKAIASEQADEIRRVAEQIAKKGEVLGPRGRQEDHARPTSAVRAAGWRAGQQEDDARRGRCGPRHRRQLWVKHSRPRDYALTFTPDKPTSGSALGE